MAQLPFTPKNTAYAVGYIKGIGGVVVAENTFGSVLCHWSNTKEIGKWENRDNFKKAFEIAAEKLGYKKDRRCKCGWRKMGN